MVKNFDRPLFLGLSHLGQVFSISWSKKIGSCSVYDYDYKSLKEFKEKKFTSEEPLLSSIKTKNINILSNEEEIKKNNLIFFTYDTPIKQSNGYPNLKYIENKLKKLLQINFKKKTYIIILSQVYPGYMDYIIKKIKIRKNIKLFYMVDTLRMGTAIDIFLNPDQLVFGSKNITKDKAIIKKIFKKFKCKKYFYSYRDAELVKVALNIFLFFSVSYSNIIDQLSWDNELKYSNIIENIKNDNRIGKFSYTNPSIGISGGHLERDIFYFQKLNKNLISKKILNSMLNFNDYRKKRINKLITKLSNNKKIKLLIIGLSYKQNSFSLTNSPFKFLFRNKNYIVSVYDDFFKINPDKSYKILNSITNLKFYDFIIFNYSNISSVKKIKNFCIKKSKSYLFNISLDKKQKFKGQNVINFFNR